MSSLNQAAKGAVYTSILQAVLRLSTFVLNAVILRYISLEVLGVVNMRLMLLYNTVLFLSREPIRKACLSRLSEGRNWTLIFNLSWISVPIGMCCCLALGLLWLSPSIMAQPDDGSSYTKGVMLFCVATLLELLTEPLWILGQAHQYVTTKVLVEGASQLCKCVFTVIMVMWFPHWGVTALSIANLSYSIVYLFSYYGYFYYHLWLNKTLPINRLQDIFPKAIPGQPSLDAKLRDLALSFCTQSFLKQLLTDGEKYIITYFNFLTFAMQGVYDTINNLGSLVPRFIFQPIEENFSIYFANSLYRGKPANEQPEKEVKVAAEILARLLKLVILVAMIILVFGYSYSFLLLDIYGGQKLTSGDGHKLLRVYCLYILFLAVNGITEGFMFAVMSQEHVDRHNRWLVVFSVLYLMASFVLTWLCGSTGLILANCVNMAIRIICSILFINNFFSTTPFNLLKDCIPSKWLNITFIIIWIATALSEVYISSGQGWMWRLVHVGVGLVCLCWLLLMILFLEQELCQFIYQRLPKRITSKMDFIMKYFFVIQR
ncbi:man(5)GlcNAc(2)-PP-dolichol translocation protein RFT1-like [Dysidea avara]|uniref:man(5)GlcNAc(2)-PP-dolichol translocation protein RFT1-like n=1 Tax=Dysidea avara TaxID=196820 RepID=UPI003330878B